MNKELEVQDIIRKTRKAKAALNAILWDKNIRNDTKRSVY